jgi:carbohydrate-binding DOMON domain-containing protein
MDIEIIIEGGEELSKMYPKHYEKFLEMIGDIINDLFPGVGGYSVASELTKNHQAEKKEREQLQQQRDKELLDKILQEPEFKEKIQAILAAPDQQAPGVSP